MLCCLKVISPFLDFICSYHARPYPCASRAVTTSVSPSPSMS